MAVGEGAGLAAGREAAHSGEVIPPASEAPAPPRGQEFRIDRLEIEPGLGDDGGDESARRDVQRYRHRQEEAQGHAVGVAFRFRPPLIPHHLQEACFAHVAAAIHRLRHRSPPRFGPVLSFRAAGRHTPGNHRLQAWLAGSRARSSRGGFLSGVRANTAGTFRR